VGLHTVTIAEVRTDIPAEKFWKKAVAEIESPTELEDASFVKGRFLSLSAGQRHTLPRLRHLHLLMEDSTYWLVSVEDSGAFLAVKEGGH
jgi:hypothetical protein